MCFMFTQYFYSSFKGAVNTPFPTRCTCMKIWNIFIIGSHDKAKAKRQSDSKPVFGKRGKGLNQYKWRRKVALKQINRDSDSYFTVGQITDNLSIITSKLKRK